MNTSDDSNNKTDDAEDEQALGEFWRVTLWILGCLGVVVAISLFWFFVSYALDPRITDPINFIGVSVLNTLIFIAIVSQVIIYRKQRDIMKQQWQAMQDALGEAKEQTRIAGESLTKLERPFVFRESINYLWHPDRERSGKYFYSIRPILANSGNSPTKKMVLSVNCAIRDAPLPDDFDYPYPHGRQPSAIGPHGHIIAGILKITDDDLLAVQEGAKHFYLWGKAEYTDVFEGTGTHTTRFCNRISEVYGNPLMPRIPHNPGGSGVEIVFEIYGGKYNSIH